MRLTISHETHYQFDAPASYGLQQLRKTPQDGPGQVIQSWTTDIQGGTSQCQFKDQHGNQVTLVSLNPGVREITIRSEGEVDISDISGVIGRHRETAPLWYYHRQTRLTQPGPVMRKLARADGEADMSDVSRLHALMTRVADEVRYEVGSTHAHTSGEEAAADGTGVCQDQAHVMIGAARLLGYPARYVSGYLLMPERNEQDASHAWAEIHVDGLGWVGFDPANRKSPDDHYVRIAVGLDYSEAAPVSGLTFGEHNELMKVSLLVQQQ